MGTGSVCPSHRRHGTVFFSPCLQAMYQEQRPPTPRNYIRVLVSLSVIHCVTIAFTYAAALPPSAWSGLTWIEVVVCVIAPVVISVFCSSSPRGSITGSSGSTTPRKQRGCLCVCTLTLQLVVGGSGLPVWVGLATMGCAVVMAVVPVMVDLSVKATTFAAVWTVTGAAVVYRQRQPSDRTWLKRMLLSLLS